MARLAGDGAKKAAAIATVVAAVAIAHGGALRNGFVALDDDLHVYENSHVLGGLGADGVAWAFSLEGHQTYFQPLAWLSLMLDRTLFGPGPWGFHLVNLLLHAGTALLFLATLARATGRLAPSLAAALLFAVHPLTVEAVAWITERNMLLSSFLGLAAILAYVHHAERPSRGRLAAATALFVASLLAKPTLVTMPALLLALDSWPLRRLRREGDAGDARPFPRVTLRAALLEKVPFAIACAAALAVSMMTTQEPPGEPAPADAPNATGFTAPFAIRSANAIASVARYAAAALWPSGLSVLHPYPNHVPAAAVVAGVAVLAGATAAACAMARRRPFLLAGWLWFLVALAPFLGIVQAGLWPGWAERFAYVPLLGLTLAASFAAAEIAGRGRAARAITCAAGALGVGALAVACRVQVGYWRDSEALFRRAIAVEALAPEMHYKLGATLMDAGRTEEAEAALETAVRLGPWQPWAQARLAFLLAGRGRTAEAEDHYRAAIRWDPESADALVGLADLLRRTGRGDEARPFYLRYGAVRARGGR